MSGASQIRAASPCGIVIFGASGDLTKRLLMPSLANMARSGILPEKFALIGVGRSPLGDDAFRAHLRGEGDAADADGLLQRATYVAGDPADPATMSALAAAMAAADRREGLPGAWLFYLATPPDAVLTIARSLGAAGLLADSRAGWRRLIVEKPFGTDLGSALTLNRRLLEVMREDQIFRIDHYLGKETVQNILVFRFANGMFEPIWNRDHIEHIQITVAETVGVETRASYYDRSGALRDMVPNHLFQLLALVAMEPPNTFAAEAVRTEKVKVLEAVQPLSPTKIARDVVRGQYRPGPVGGKAYRSYRDEDGVAERSATETYVAMKLKIDTWRWAEMPFYLRTGKALAARRTEIAVQFRQAPYAMFRDTPVEALTPNFMVLAIQPDEGISLRFSAKIPGPSVKMKGAEMNFKYTDLFDVPHTTGYETLLYDCMNGDATLFQRADFVEAGWRVVDPVLAAWKAAGDRNLAPYAAGSQGPDAADALMMRDRRRWRTIP